MPESEKKMFDINFENVGKVLKGQEYHPVFASMMEMLKQYQDMDPKQILDGIIMGVSVYLCVASPPEKHKELVHVLTESVDQISRYALAEVFGHLVQGADEKTSWKN